MALHTTTQRSLNVGYESDTTTRRSVSNMTLQTNTQRSVCLEHDTANYNTAFRKCRHGTTHYNTAFSKCRVWIWLYNTAFCKCRTWHYRLTHSVLYVSNMTLRTTIQRSVSVDITLHTKREALLLWTRHVFVRYSRRCHQLTMPRIVGWRTNADAGITWSRCYPVSFTEKLKEIIKSWYSP
jgi:hypothetical protein